MKIIITKIPCPVFWLFALFFFRVDCLYNKKNTTEKQDEMVYHKTVR